MPRSPVQELPPGTAKDNALINVVVRTGNPDATAAPITSRQCVWSNAGGIDPVDRVRAFDERCGKGASTQKLPRVPSAHPR
jgi:hypothetical protein